MPMELVDQFACDVQGQAVHLAYISWLGLLLNTTTGNPSELIAIVTSAPAFGPSIFVTDQFEVLLQGWLLHFANLT